MPLTSDCEEIGTSPGGFGRNPSLPPWRSLRFRYVNELHFSRNTGITMIIIETVWTVIILLDLLLLSAGLPALLMGALALFIRR
jgi:hypothetical protein